MPRETFDVVVVGSGPAGYIAAIRASQLGFKTAIVEKDQTLGGTCLNVGCIPSKALLDSSEKFEAANHHFADHGIEVKAKLDLKKLVERKDGVVKTLTGGIAMLMKKHKITVVKGWGKLAANNIVTVDDKEELEAKHIILCPGSVPIELPIAKFDGKNVVSSTEALSFASVPRHLVVIGAGYIGLEMGSVWRRLGAKVTLVDVMPQALANVDADVSKEVTKLFTKQGLEFIFGAKVSGTKAGKAGVEVTYEKDGKAASITADKVLVCVGRKPATAGMGLDSVGVKVDNRGFIEVGDHFKTSVPGVYAVGDCVNTGPLLAHKAEEEAVACVERIAGIAGHVNYKAIPWVVYTWPEVAGVGLSEQEAKAAGHEVKTGKFSFRANGRAIAIAETEGFVKVVADKKTDRLLGLHIVGANASEMVAEAACAMEFSASAEDLARICHAHPTMSEAMKEAALAVGSGTLNS